MGERGLKTEKKGDGLGAFLKENLVWTCKGKDK